MTPETAAMLIVVTLVLFVELRTVKKHDRPMKDNMAAIQRMSAQAKPLPRNEA